jgi:hypothetical protein
MFARMPLDVPRQCVVLESKYTNATANIEHVPATRAVIMQDVQLEIQDAIILVQKEHASESTVVMREIAPARIATAHVMTNTAISSTSLEAAVEAALEDPVVVVLAEVAAEAQVTMVAMVQMVPPAALAQHQHRTTARAKMRAH